MALMGMRLSMDGTPIDNVPVEIAPRVDSNGLFVASDGQFLEIHVDTSLEVAESRDVKGLYGKARRGELKNFTGIDAPYEVPQNPALRVNTGEHTAEQAADMVVALLRAQGLIN